MYKHHLAAAATKVGAVALAVAADLRLRACLAFCRMSFLRIARAVAVDLSPTSQQTLWTGTVAAAAVAVDLRKLSGLCPVLRGRLFLRFATVVTVTVMFLRGATVARVGIRSPGLRRWADWVTAMWIRGAVGRVMFLRDGTAVTGIKDVTVMFLSDVTVTAMLLRGAMMSFLLLRRRLRHLVFPLMPPLMRLPPFNFSPPFSCMRLWIP